MLIFWAQKWDIESWVLNGKGLGNRPGSLQASCPLPTASHWPAHKEEWIAPPISINLPLSMTHTPLLSPHSSPLMPPTFISFALPSLLPSFQDPPFCFLHHLLFHSPLITPGSPCLQSFCIFCLSEASLYPSLSFYLCLHSIPIPSPSPFFCPQYDPLRFTHN